MLDRIDAFERAVIPAGLRSLAQWLQPGLLAMVLIQAVGLSVMAARIWLADQAPVYRTLGDEPQPAPAGSIRVVPDAAMALTDWNTLLHILHLRVVGGPDAAGAYLVVPLSPTATTRHTLQQLRATRGIRLAEVVPAGR
jgi:hypothetical protein